MGIKVKVRNGESIRKVLKRLKKTIDREGIQRDIMRHRYYETESVRRRRQRLRNNRKRARG